jgi:hypothetical protein
MIILDIMDVERGTKKKKSIFSVIIEYSTEMYVQSS